MRQVGINCLIKSSTNIHYSFEQEEEFEERAKDEQMRHNCMSKMHLLLIIQFTIVPLH